MASADATATFAMDLEDGTSGPAASAAAALTKLESQLKGDTQALAAMNRAMKNLQSGTVVNVKLAQELRNKIAAKRQAIQQAQESYLSLGGSLTKTAAKGRQAAGGFGLLSKVAGEIGGPIGGLASRLEKFIASAGDGAGKALLLKAGLLALGAAAAVATIALLQYGIAAADARRTDLLQLEGLTKVRNWYGLVADKASFLQSTIDSVSASTALGRGRVAQYAQQLYGMGLRAGNLQAALQGVTTVAAVQGEAQASMWAGWAAGAARTGQSVKALAADVKARLGGIAAAQMLSLTVQTEKLHESFTMLFSGLHIETLLEGLGKVTQLFSQNTASGRGLKLLVETLFQPMVNVLPVVATLAKNVIQGLILGFLRIHGAVLDLELGILRAIGPRAIRFLKDLKSPIGDLDLAFRLATASGELLGGAMLYLGGKAIIASVTTIATTLWGAASAAVAFAAPILLVAAPFLLAGAAVAVLGYQLYKLWQVVNVDDWKSLGTGIINGLVSGITGGAKWVLDAVRNLATSAWGAFKEKLGIHSPSKVFMGSGLMLSAGVVGGVKAGTPAVNQAVRGMVRVPSMPEVEMSGRFATPSIPAPERAALSGGGARAARGGGATGGIRIEHIHVHANTDKPRELAQSVKDELNRILEGMAIHAGGAPA